MVVLFTMKLSHVNTRNKYVILILIMNNKIRILDIMLKLVTFSVLVLNLSIASANPLIGTWQFVKGQYATDNGLVEAQAPQLSSVKIVSDGHFNYITQRDGKFLYAGGGTYTLDKGWFIEHVKYGNVESILGKTMAFTYIVEGDLWHHTLHENGKLVEKEVWKRIDL